MGVFKRLNDEIGGEEDGGGISPIDLLDLPEEQRTIMRYMLREVEISYEEIVEDVSVEQDLLNSSLATLVSEGWLIKMGETRVLYRVNLRRKSGSKLAKNIWAALDTRIESTRIAAAEKKDEDDSGS